MRDRELLAKTWIAFSDHCGFCLAASTILVSALAVAYDGLCTLAADGVSSLS